MSTRLIPTKPTLRQKNLRWMNMLVHTHDLFCDCSAPLQHTVILIHQQEPDIDYLPIEKDIIKRCLTGETTGGAAADPEGDGLDAGTLEDLFKEDFGEENDTG